MPRFPRARPRDGQTVRRLKTKRVASGNRPFGGISPSAHRGFRLAVPDRDNGLFQVTPAHNFAFLIRAAGRYRAGMALVRILVDGYSLLHRWPELAPGKSRHSEAARDALIRELTRYQDAVGTPVTIFFDGAGRRGPARAHDTPHTVEVLFSRNGKTADALIERAAHRFAAWGEVLAVTNDTAERDTVVAVGGFASSCEDFIREVNGVLGDQSADIRDHNRRERNHFHRRR